jgi:O-antigen/teichoic acid export membrane protein
LGLIISAFLLESGLSGIVLAYLAGKVTWAVTISIAAIWQAGKEWGRDWWQASFSLITPRRKELIKFALNTNLSGTLTLITRDSEELWLGGFTTPLQVGYYKIAKAIMGIVLIPVNPLIGTTYREVAREVATRSWGNVKYLLRSGSLLSAAWTLPAVIGLILFGQWVVWMYNPEALPESYITLLILLVGALVVNVFFWNRSVLLPLGLPDYPTKVLFIAALLKVAGTILLVPQFGAYGMAVLLSAFFVFSSLVLVWKTVREIQRVEALPAAQGV